MYVRVPVCLLSSLTRCTTGNLVTKWQKARQRNWGTKVVACVSDRHRVFYFHQQVIINRAPRFAPLHIVGAEIFYYKSVPNADMGEGVEKADCFANVINGCSLITRTLHALQDSKRYSLCICF